GVWFDCNYSKRLGLAFALHVADRCVPGRVEAVYRWRHSQDPSGCSRSPLRLGALETIRKVISRDYLPTQRTSSEPRREQLNLTHRLRIRHDPLGQKWDKQSRPGIARWVGDGGIINVLSRTNQAAPLRQS